MHIFVRNFQKSVVMKQVLAILTVLTLAFSFASCEKEIIVNCNCNCNCGGSDDSDKTPGSSDETPGRPGENPGDNNGGSDNGGSNGNIDRSEYTTYNTTFTKGQAGYFGVYYEDQPSTTSNWYLELADNNYDLESYEGTGYNVSLEFFTNNSFKTSFPAGEYTIEKFDATPYAAGSLLYGFIGEDETYGEYTAGTWLFEGNEGIAGATAGKMTVAVSGSKYNISYTLYDDEYQIAFSGSYSGNITIYDGTQTASYAPALPSFAPRATKANTKYFKVRR